ncbi:MAG: hypothetical protein ACO3HF_06625 [Burkholderiaceae bacterium]
MLDAQPQMHNTLALDDEVTAAAKVVIKHHEQAKAQSSCSMQWVPLAALVRRLISSP